MKNKSYLENVADQLRDRMKKSNSSHGLDDTGARTTFASGGQRELAPGKGRYDLLPGAAILAVIKFSDGELLPIKAIDALARHYEAGAKKYAPRNWEKGIPLWSFLDSGLRHMYKARAGSKGEDHEVAALWNLVGYVDTDLAITYGDMPTSLRDPVPRRQQKWGGHDVAGVNVLADSNPDIETAITATHSFMATYDSKYILYAIRALAHIISKRPVDAKA